MALDSPAQETASLIDSGPSFRKYRTDLGEVTLSGTADFLNAAVVLKSGETLTPDPERDGELVSNWNWLEDMGYHK